MRIAIDYTPAVLQQAGIGRYTRDLVRALLALDSGHEFVLLGPRGSTAPGWLAAHPEARWAVQPFPQRIAGGLWYRLRLPAPVEWITGPVDIFHATDYVAPPRRRARSVVTVHDLSFLRHPEYAEARLARFLAAAVPPAVRAASAVLADSEFTRSEVLTLLDAPPERVSVVYGAVGETFRRVRDPDRLDAVRRRYRLPDRFILNLGRIEPRKNITGLLHAYRRLLDSGGCDVGLAIAGGRGWLYDAIFRTVSDLALDHHVRFLDHVAEEDLAPLLSACAAFVYPSFYEGFGLPPLEAMACGAPVIASSASSLPEVLGDAALLVPPGDPESLSAAIARVLSDPEYAAALRHRGPLRAAAFTWPAAAQQLLTAYDRAVQ